MSHAQRIIEHIDPEGPNPAGVEAWMRATWGTLNDLPHECFVEETGRAAAEERRHPGTLRGWATVEGLARDFEKWEKIRAERARATPA